MNYEFSTSLIMGRRKMERVIMSEKQFDLLVFIGRFQPFHREHKRVVDIALANAKEVLVMVGSSFRARTPKNPFTYAERSDMILMSYPVGTPLVTDAVRDYPYDDARWAKEVDEQIRDYALGLINGGGFRNHGVADLKIGIIGTKKDDSTFYLDMFPQYELLEVELQHVIHATDIRHAYFTGSFWTDDVPEATYKFMKDFVRYDEFTDLVNWQAEIDTYKMLWESAPYPVKHVTADAIVKYHDRILLVERLKDPGFGQWAVPGGHVNVGERVEAAALRELREETLIPLTDAELRSRIKGKQVFDDPGRSTIGHVITHAVFIDLSDLEEQPEVTGADDAAVAIWARFDRITEDMFYDDHWHMIQHFLA